MAADGELEGRSGKVSPEPGREDGVEQVPTDSVKDQIVNNVGFASQPVSVAAPQPWPWSSEAA